MGRGPSSFGSQCVLGVVMLVVGVVVASRLLLAGLVNGGSLGNAVVVALPHDVGVGREAQQTLDRFSENNKYMSIFT